jgi:hypothetical protein
MIKELRINTDVFFMCSYSLFLLHAQRPRKPCRSRKVVCGRQNHIPRIAAQVARANATHPFTSKCRLSISFIRRIRKTCPLAVFKKVLNVSNVCVPTSGSPWKCSTCASTSTLARSSVGQSRELAILTPAILADHKSCDKRAECCR